MKTYKVAAFCQDDISPERLSILHREFTIKAKNESEAEDKADKQYKNLMGFTADTICATEV